MAGISDVWLGQPFAEHWPDDLTIKGGESDQNIQMLYSARILRFFSMTSRMHRDTHIRLSSLYDAAIRGMRNKHASSEGANRRFGQQDRLSFRRWASSAPGERSMYVLHFMGHLWHDVC